VTKQQRQKKIARIETLIKRLTDNQTVSKRDFESVLTKEQITEYNEHIKNKSQWVKEQRRFQADSEYLKFLKKGDFAYARMNHYSLSGKHATAERLSIESENWYEKALECLLTIDPCESMFYDRDVTNLNSTERNDLGLYPEGMPRPINSKSINLQPNRKNDLKVDIRGERIALLERVLSELENETEVDALATATPKSPPLSIEEIEAQLLAYKQQGTKGDSLARLKFQIQNKDEIERLQSLLQVRKLQARLLTEDEDDIHWQ